MASSLGLAGAYVRSDAIDRIVPNEHPQALGRRTEREGVTMTSTATPAQPETASSAASWWGRHRDLVLYPTVFVVVASLGLAWNGALSLVLTPVWMLLGVWLIPAGIARVVAAARERRTRGPRR